MSNDNIFVLILDTVLYFILSVCVSFRFGFFFSVPYYIENDLVFFLHSFREQFSISEIFVSWQTNRKMSTLLSVCYVRTKVNATEISAFFVKSVLAKHSKSWSNWITLFSRSLHNNFCVFCFYFLFFSFIHGVYSVSVKWIRICIRFG